MAQAAGQGHGFTEGLITQVHNRDAVAQCFFGDALELVRGSETDVGDRGADGKGGTAEERQQVDGG